MGQERFDYQVAKGGTVRIFWEGRCIITLGGERGRRLVADLADADDDQIQYLLRRVTGNFKRGNERRPRVRSSVTQAGLSLDDMGAFEIDIAKLQPSQLYVCDEKLAEVERSLAPGEALDPVPVKRLDGRLVLTDGHTRALAALRRGDRTIPVCWETGDLDWEAYRICVKWCLDEGIQTAADLRDRILPGEEYETLWIERCQAMHGNRAQGDEMPRCTKKEDGDV